METLTTTPSRILPLLQDLSPENLAVVEQFVRFVRDQARHGQLVVTLGEAKNQPPYLYPTVVTSASSLSGWRNLLSVGYEGDALADSEALYDVL